MEKFSNSQEHGKLEEPLKWRIEMLREYMPNWNEKKDKEEIKACLAAQKLAYVEGIDYGEYQNSYIARMETTVTIHDNKEIFEEIFGKNASLEDADTHFIDHMSEAIRTNKTGDMLSIHLYNDKTKKKIPEGMIDEYDKFATLRDLREGKEKKKATPAATEIKPAKNQNKQFEINFDRYTGR